MKKILSFLFVIVLSLCMTIAATAATEKNLSSSLGNSLTDEEIEKGFEYALMSGSDASEIAIYGFDADILGTDVVIPETIHGIKVTHIYGGGVFGWKKLTSLTIPDSVTSIGKGAFKKCKKLTSITIGNGVTSIGSCAFDDTAWYNSQPDGDVYAGKVYYRYKGTMPNNTSVSIKDGTKSIVDSAFKGCTGLTSITIPDSVMSIGCYAFKDCTGLTKVSWNAESIKHIWEYYDMFSNAGTSGEGIDVTFGDNVKYIPSYLFYAYEETPKIKTVTIGNSVTSIGDSAFKNCTGLTKINWNAENVEEDFEYDYVFSNAGISGDGIDIVFGDSVKVIPDSAFRKANVKSIIIGNSVTSIGSYAFYGCTGITSITIPDSVTSIGGYAFAGTSWYSSQPDGDVYAGKFYYKYKGTMLANTKVTIKDGTKGIVDSAFRSCTGLTNITIPDGVTSIGDRAFEDCTRLTSITVPDSVTSIGDFAFDQCTRLANITIPNNVTSIGRYAFYGCTGLTSATLGANIKIIRSGTFYGCKGLENVTIPQNVRVISESAFQGCSGMKTMTFESRQISIGNYAFGYDENDIPYEGFTIKGYEHSSAEVYALLNGFDFVSLDKEEHVHFYTVKTYVQPTCLSIGYEVRACSCGDTYTVTLPALGHTDEDNDGICDRCEEKLPDKEEHVHYYTVKTYVQPTCLSIGYEVRACSCGDTYTVTLPALGHTDEDNDGVCDRCEEKLAAQPEEPTEPDTPSDDKNNDNAFVAFFKQIIELLKKLFNLLGKRA